MAEDVVTWDEAVSVVDGLVSWLKGAPEGSSLQLTKPGALPITFVPDAKRAGYVLECVMKTAGHG